MEFKNSKCLLLFSFSDYMLQLKRYFAGELSFYSFNTLVIGFWFVWLSGGHSFHFHLSCQLIQTNIVEQCSSNINEVIRAVLNPLFFLYFTKWFRTHQKHKKAQNANKQTKIKNALKNIWLEKSNLFAYLCFCVFCARQEKKKENRK